MPARSPFLHLLLVTLTQFSTPAFSIPLQSQWEDQNSLGTNNDFQGYEDPPDFLFPDPMFPKIPGTPLSQAVNINSTESGNSTENVVNMSNTDSDSGTNKTQESQDVQGQGGVEEQPTSTSTQSDEDSYDTDLLEAIFSMVDYEVDSEYFSSDSRGAVHEEKHYQVNGVETSYIYNKTGL